VLETVPATGTFDLLWLVIAIPLVSAGVLLLAGRRSDGWGHLLGCAAALASFAIGLAQFFALRGEPTEGRHITQHLFSWIPVNGLQVDAALLLDPLSATFVLLITGVGSLIHIYSVGYMGHDPDRRRFFAYLNLFIAAMLLLVLADSYLGLYVGWEGVGLASYLLIAFWSYKPAAATAAKKAFIANRVGDVGLSIAIMIMFAQLGTTSFAGVFDGASALSNGLVTAIGLMLLLGACGKSGQFPLQTWLPDAMEGPTPVSALIHAATMVTAGVYLIARSHPLFDLSEDARTVVIIVGTITLVYGALCGTSYDDIKKVLAYSTVSQIGYMFLAVGLGPIGYAFGILHLLTHGFFKAGLFLGAGSVMHAMDDEVDMRRYGGLAKVLPVTFVTFGLGYLALIGFPGLSGFFSKDKIIEAAFDKGGATGTITGTCALLAAGVTAFYMTRLMCMTFFGEPRWREGVHPHEASRSMTVPMIILAIGSVFAGAFLTLGHRLQDWLEPSLGKEPEITHAFRPEILTALTLVVVAGGVLAGWLFVGKRKVSVVPPLGVSRFTKAARKALYADALNENVLMRPGQWLTGAAVFVDNRGVDGAVNGLAALVGGSSGRLRRIQTGFVRSYALSIFGGTLLVLLALVIVRTV
jgi:NADH-quinone oxidoreductase subunit L